MNTFDTIRQIIVDHFGVKESAVHEHASFRDDLGFDSLDEVELVMICEELFGEISDDDAELCLTVRDAVRLAERVQHNRT